MYVDSFFSVRFVLFCFVLGNSVYALYADSYRSENISIVCLFAFNEKFIFRKNRNMSANHLMIAFYITIAQYINVEYT